MSELIKNAWLGWLAFNEPGKLAALLLILLIFIWVFKGQETGNVLTIYTTFITVLCICPVSAAVLMLYQTRFYDYQWIWSMVPMTIFIAYGLTVFVTCFYRFYVKKDKKHAKGIFLVVPVLLFFCGGMGVGPQLDYFRHAERTEAEKVLEQVKVLSGEKTVYLWAPRDILDYAREYDSSIELIYGRNMWDISLNAYSHDVYNEESVSMYQWMDGAEGIKISDAECADFVLASGVNCVLLPVCRTEETITCFNAKFGKEAQSVGNYYVWIL